MDGPETVLSLSLAPATMEKKIGCQAPASLRQSSSQSTVTSSQNNDISSVKREGVSPEVVPRKKLRLTKEQSALLEHNFKENKSLSPKEKKALAVQLHLRPRQVEVWFQNRRARTKLKQTQVDCEYLRSYWEVLREENGRLQKEVRELKSLKLAPAEAATLTLCSSCRMLGSSSSSSNAG